MPGAMDMRAARAVAGAAFFTLVTACGGGGGGSMPPPGGPPPFTSVTQARVSQPSTFLGGCDGVAATGRLYADTAAEPYLVVNPTSPMNLISAWQQNRWSDGGAQGLNFAASFDGGMTWTPSNAAVSRCTGGNPGNAGNYARATDVWLTVSPVGAVYALSLSFTGGTLLAGSSSAMLVAQSHDGGQTWGAPIALIQDGATAFNDKGSITADSTDANYVYAVWDRLTGQTAGPSYFAVTADAGSTWLPARSIYDPGAQSQTLGNQIVVLPGDVVLDVFTELGAQSALVRVMQSSNHGTNWSAPVTVSDLQAVGTTDPNTHAVVRDGSGLVSVSVGPGGIIYVAWQDSRFSGGQHDGIAMTHSADGGLTWSVPVQVNADHSVQAFTPTIHVRADGVIGVTYYDLRNATSSPASLLTDCWLVTSSDGVTFRESHLSGPFDLDLAPNSQGLFLGDYQSLASSASGFLPFYVQTDAGTQVRSDAFIAFPPATASVQALAGAAGATFQARAAPAGMTQTPAARQRVMERLRLTRAQRRHQPG
ncbi:MAG TPA: sialidase family protein [Steroidobacteraceae bacterium]|nr:sialidase family protein [Steroidobacteraceae bacterium]